MTEDNQASSLSMDGPSSLNSEYNSNSSRASIRQLQQASACETDHQCLHGGSCVTTDIHGFVVRHCACPKDVGGRRCEHYCPIQCQHGGTCRHVGDGTDRPSLDRREDRNPDHYECQCPGRGWAGQLCDVPYENCGHDVRCLNGGVCRQEEEEGGNIENNGNSPSCVCPEGFSGMHCEIQGGGVQSTPVSLPEESPLSTPQRATLSATAGLLGLGLLVWAGYVTYRRKRRGTSGSYSTISYNPVLNSNNISPFGLEMEEVQTLRKPEEQAGMRSPGRWKHIV